jgi:hypothetical protein
MAEAGSADQGQKGGFGKRGRRTRQRRRTKEEERSAWVPLTKLGRLVKEGKIKFIEEVCSLLVQHFSFPFVSDLLGLLPFLAYQRARNCRLVPSVANCVEG